MSLPASKSKTQLAYTRSTKAVNKPKAKSNNQIQQNDLTKTKNPAKSSTNNIYDSIMGQIDNTQQDYIKSLIVKNQKETLKSQKESQKELTKGLKQSHQPKKTTVSIKTTKQSTVPQKVSMTNLHQKTKSQTDLLLSQSQISIVTQKLIKVEDEKQNNNIRYVSEQAQNSIASSQVKIIASQKDNSKKQQFSTTFPQSQKQQKTNGSSNPIIEALNNTSSSFAKKLEAFQLQYPTQERQQRITHKKGASKLSGEYFSCQTSPKNGAKHVYAQEVIVTTKPEEAYYNSANKNHRPQSIKISPISAGKNSDSKINAKRLNENQQNIPTSFLSCLDEYLQALTLNTNQGQQNNRPSNGSYNMKRKNSNKMKEFPTAKGLSHPFALDKEDEEEETIVLQSVNYHNALHNKIGQPKHLSLAQQQKIIKSLQKEKRKVSEMKSIIDLFNQQLTKYKKKQKKMKQNQFHMIQCLKSLNSDLTEQKKQRRRLQQVVKDFESKIRGISNGKNKKRRGSMDEEQRVERKTIYGMSSMGNSIHYGQAMGNNFYYQPENIQKDSRQNMQRPSKKGSKNRFSSVINSMTQDYSRNALNVNDQHDDSDYPQKRGQIQDKRFSKNRTQKISKIISSFELDNQLGHDDDQMVYRSSQIRNSIKNMNPPNSCKNSYMNSSLPGSRQAKSRPMTPKLIEELFKGNNTKKQRTQQIQSQFFNQRMQNNNFDSESEQESSTEYVRQQLHQNYDDRKAYQSQEDDDSEFNPPTHFDESDQCEDNNQRDYRHVQQRQNDMVMRLR